MKNKKRLICSICAVFMVAFSLILIPFSQIDSASASSYNESMNSFSSDKYFFPDGITDTSRNYAAAYYGQFDITSGRNLNGNIDYNYVTINTNFHYYTADSKTMTLGLRQTGYVLANGSSYFNLPVNQLYTLNYCTYDYETAYVTNQELVTGQYTVTGYNDNWHIFRYLLVPHEVKNYYETASDVWTGNVNRVVFGSSLSNPILENVNFNYNYIGFIDNLDNAFYFILGDYSIVGDDYSPNYVIGSFWNYQVYYINLDLSDNAIYQDGYRDGLESGEISGYQNGYNQGFINGENTGYGEGYNQGVENSANYTFLGLIGAVIDAPIKSFRGLFNFDLLGVNMVSLITGLFTLCVIVCIVKLVLGGK